ncbi:protein kinase [Myxococcus llanfairpwllgwyngyllgogerychwyrndrobwllllantysiliogogogochensis]|uniref:Protein kinase n=1 Tax=Myxococcus llanfairpwllgwyngyllgogerychwyrndrobwllllantysiliogogogochensis TaxID=2590453 RepID=A0A540X9H7_9BACT|nr:protein kinase [Myxococcus llanfairpwllgwyngyllgogerychwyrndrobwllllantysiliogogogochensis]TQF17955.1 protein kinase [Myxococcus llanfairpwllgwyngyllgogerychwyrndrobwllllantysiliogogogochensis]
MSPPSSDASAQPHVLLRSGRASYELVKSLGAAHHGELLLARRRYESDFGGYAVIKRPLRAEAAHRLWEEGRLTALLHHPNVVSVHDLKGPDEAPVLVFEHTPGHRLDSLMEASGRAHLPFTEGFSLYVAAEVAEALHHAHTLTDEHGRALRVVHRDVGPHNILITEHGAVKLLDFGAASSALSGTPEGQEHPTSLAYAAPEHVARQALDGRADLFSLGLVLLQLLTGRHLFEGADRFEAERRRRREQALSSDTPTQEHALDSAMQEAVSVAAARELRRRIRAYTREDLEDALRAVPVAFQPLLRGTLAPEREERFGTGAELARTLRLYARRAGQVFGRADALAEVTGLRYAALRVQAGESPEEVLEDRLLPEEDPAS